jgi:hypothetical protein
VADLTPIRTMSIEKVRNLLKSSLTCLKDARISQLSIARRFDAAYDAGFCCARAVLEVSKLECKGPGHHKDTLQFLVDTLGLKGDTAALIPSLTQTRNASRYDAAPVLTENMVTATITWAERLQAETEAWFQKKHPQALKN